MARECLSPGAKDVDLCRLPPIFIIPTKLDTVRLERLRDQLKGHGINILDEAKEATLFLGIAGTKQRAAFELRRRDIWTEEVTGPRSTVLDSEPSRKRRKFDGNGSSGRAGAVSADEGDSTASDVKSEDASDTATTTVASGAAASADDALLGLQSPGSVTFLKLSWIEDCMAAGKVRPMSAYFLYKGRIVDRPVASDKSIESPITLVQATNPKHSSLLRQADFQGILTRAKADATASGHSSNPSRWSTKEGHRLHHYGTSSLTSNSASRSLTRPTHLLHQTTSEHEALLDGKLPPLPAWVTHSPKYSCQRRTPLQSPNAAFIAELSQIKLSRILTLDEIGVRAYSTAIASLSAYPHVLTSPREITRLPGCSEKIAHLFQEFSATGTTDSVAAIASDPQLTILRHFWEIWGVGAVTARDFLARGWRDLDDIVDNGWQTLSRVQQIGVKYYDEFLEKIPRDEVERIASIVKEHARRVRDDGITCCIVGGYRRGKTSSGDVDLVLSHRDHGQTLGLVDDVVRALESSRWITHTLTLTLANSKRDQQPVAYRSVEGPSRGGGFDTLDKALVVWQDPGYDRTSGHDRNPNLHRRVDIIVAPWKFVGCAVVGWSGGTTFQRDLRRYAKEVKGWKFDSSGVRDRSTGEVVDVEDVGGVSRTVEEAERKVFDGLGLEYIEPEDRCTG